MSDSNLYEASHQWANRPDDQRFETIAAMHAATLAYANSAKEATVTRKALTVVEDKGNLCLVGKLGTPAKITHYAFGQLARLVGAPAEYLRRLSPSLAATNLNAGIAEFEPDEKARILFHQNGSLVTRAITSESYDRVWDHEVIERIGKRLISEGWRVPPARPARPGQQGTRPATAADILPGQGDFGLAVKVGDPIAPAGLYASDHDMFAFLVDQADPATDGAHALNRGAFIQNSEVGDSSLRIKLFVYDNVCGNHIVWNASKVTEISVRHVKGERAHSGRTLQNALSKWHVASRSLPSGSALSAQIAQAQAKEIAGSKDEVLDALFAFGKARSLSRLTRPTLTAAYDLAERTPRYGSPRSVWGMVNGLTEISQGGHADSRTELDTQAGRIMEIAF
jgi:hypothetical protein